MNKQKRIEDLRQIQKNLKDKIENGNFGYFSGVRDSVKLGHPDYLEAKENAQTALSQVTAWIIELEGEAKTGKVDLWIQKNFPSSTNKDTYKEVFQFIINNYQNPKDHSYTDLAKEADKKLNPELSFQSLRKAISKFVPALPL